jgi:copper homeostasis protein
VSVAAKPHRPVAVEVAVDSVAGARAADAARADRIELCCALGDGGLTPTPGLLQGVKRATRLPVVALLRPRAGDFLYASHDHEVMRADLEQLAAAGADGFAVGVLTQDGDLDTGRLRELADAAAPLPLTCHRAFDLARDPAAVLDQLIDLGFARVLTSGQCATAAAGQDRIRTLVHQARGRIEVMACAGVRAANVQELVRRTGVPAVHLSASAFIDSRMKHRNPAAPMGTQPPRGDYALRVTDGDEVARVVAVLATFAG